MLFFVSFHSNGIRLNDIYSIITHVMSCIWYASWKHSQRASEFLYKVYQTSCNGDSEVSLYILKINILIIDYFWALGIKYSRLVKETNVLTVWLWYLSDSKTACSV